MRCHSVNIWQYYGANFLEFWSFISKLNKKQEKLYFVQLSVKNLVCIEAASLNLPDTPKRGVLLTFNDI